MPRLLQYLQKCVVVRRLPNRRVEVAALAVTRKQARLPRNRAGAIGVGRHPADVLPRGLGLLRPGRNRHAPAPDPAAVLLSEGRSRKKPHAVVELARRVHLDVFQRRNVQALHRQLAHIKRVLLLRAEPRLQRVDPVDIVLLRVFAHPFERLHDARVIGGHGAGLLVIERPPERPSPGEQRVLVPELVPRDHPDAPHLAVLRFRQRAGVAVHLLQRRRRALGIQSGVPEVLLVPPESEVRVGAVRHRPHIAFVEVLLPAGGVEVRLADAGRREPARQRLQRALFRPLRHLRTVHHNDVRRELGRHGRKKLLVRGKVVRRVEKPHADGRVRAVELVGDLLKRLGLRAAPRVPHIYAHLAARRLFRLLAAAPRDKKTGQNRGRRQCKSAPHYFCCRDRRNSSSASSRSFWLSTRRSSALAGAPASFAAFAGALRAGADPCLTRSFSDTIIV